MNLVLDPAWPWSRLWELLAQVPPAIRALALMAAIATLPIPAIAFARNRGLLMAMSGVVVLSLGFVIRHLGPLALIDGSSVGGSGIVGFLLGVLWLVGLVILLLAPFALAGLSVAAYVGTPRVGRLKLMTVIGLRLLAFLLALLGLYRPSLAWSDAEQVSSQLYIVLDHSRSMTIRDERGNRSRWEQMLRAVKDSYAALARLRDDHQVEVRWFGFDTDLRDFDPDSPGEPLGNRTDFGTMLRQLFERRDASLPLRGLLVISDGADNGLTIPALSEASRWRGVPCTVHTFGCGNPRTNKQNDVAIVSISTSPTPFVPVKGRLTVKVVIDAGGFENTKARVRLFLEGEDGKDKEVTAQDVILPLTTGNEVTLRTDAPANPGEYKVKVVVETPEEDAFPLNNTIETFITVSKEGISVLLVDRQRAGEPQAICDALAEDPRIRVTPIWIRGGRPLPGTNAARLFAQDETPYDVIILGDVTLDMLNAADAQAVPRIVKLVGRGSGLMVLGGLTNLGNGGWQGSPLEPILPVDLSMKEQTETPVRMVPTEDGLRRARYLLRLDDNPDQQAVWAKLAKLDGATRLRLPEKLRGTEVVLARANDDKTGDPLLVMSEYSAGGKERAGSAGVARVLVFGGDTSHRWIRNEPSKELFSRFWRQTVIWLARQEDAAGHVWIRPDVRRLPVRGDIGFQVGLRGKGGGPDIRDGKYEVEVETPAGQTIRTPVTRGATENRGTFTATQQPGVYRLRVKGEGKDLSGGTVSGEASARVIVYDEDVEMSRPAADPEFLKKLAAAGGGGESLRVEELPDFLNRLAETPLDRGKPKQHLRPDWQTRTRSPFLMLFFVAFCAVVSLEWGLRRWWGLK